jgi:hypothetical protein
MKEASRAASTFTIASPYLCVARLSFPSSFQLSDAPCPLGTSGRHVVRMGRYVVPWLGRVCRAEVGAWAKFGTSAKMQNSTPYLICGFFDPRETDGKHFWL